MKSSSDYGISRTPRDLFQTVGKQRAKVAIGAPGFPPLNENEGRTSIDERNCGTTMTSSTTSQYDVTG